MAKIEMDSGVQDSKMIFSKWTWAEITILSILMFVVVLSFCSAELWLKITLSTLLALVTFSGTTLVAIHAQFDERAFHKKLWQDIERKDYMDRWGH